LSPLDESAYRRETFHEQSIAVVLADGQPWFLPPRGAIVYPIFETVREPGRPKRTKVTTEVGSGHGRDFDALLTETDDAIARTGKDGGPDALTSVGLMMSVARELLAINYDLADGDLTQLLPYSLSSTDYMPMWKRILAVARGEILPGAPDADEDDGE
jgi:hypothetical protein